jgi:hypothetical protein
MLIIPGNTEQNLYVIRYLKKQGFTPQPGKNLKKIKAFNNFILKNILKILKYAGKVK